MDENLLEGDIIVNTAVDILYIDAYCKWIIKTLSTWYYIISLYLFVNTLFYLVDLYLISLSISNIHI